MRLMRLASKFIFSVLFLAACVGNEEIPADIFGESIGGMELVKVGPVECGQGRSPACERCYYFSKAPTYDAGSFVSSLEIFVHVPEHLGGLKDYRPGDFSTLTIAETDEETVKVCVG